MSLDEPPPKSPTPESRFAMNLRALREALGINQSEFARRVTEAGLEGFHQTTVSRIEKGERPVRLGEAAIIAQVLGVPVDRMTGEGEDLAALARMRQRLAAAELARDNLMTAVVSFDREIERLREAIGDPSPDVDGYGWGHSPWRIDRDSDGEARRVSHEGFPEEPPSPERAARKLIGAREALRFASLLNESAEDVLRRLREEPNLILPPF
ncbi:helix-turn-helix transcriptional regulator [Cellulomonas iranensis]|uniref:helix-turn-helix transcriptional regulator n=1 Tax=Cellulomonas iranensis TaxID=76862 RepID=UPI003D7CC38D